MIENRSKTSHAILRQISKAVEDLGGSIELLCLIGSYGDTQEDEDILEMLEQYNKGDSTMIEVICSVNDTVQDRRSRFKVIDA